MDVRNILFPTDFSPCARLAFDHAARLAHCLGARLHLLHVVPLHRELPFDPMFYVPDPAAAYERAEREAQAALERLAASEVAARDDVVIAVVQAEDAAPAIVGYAHDRGIDLVVMGTHGRRGAARLLLGSNAEEVLRHCTCPVLTVRDAGGHSPGRLPPREILVPFDFSPPARGALLEAASLARRCGARLRLLHVLEEPAGDAAGTADGEPDLVAPRELRLHQLEQRLREALAWLAPRVAGDVQLRRGRPAEEILRAAQRPETDLVVMASRGISGLKRLLFGSTAEEVLRLAPAPVLVVKPELGDLQATIREVVGQVEAPPD